MTATRCDRRRRHYTDDQIRLSTDCKGSAAVGQTYTDQRRVGKPGVKPSRQGSMRRWASGEYEHAISKTESRNRGNGLSICRAYGIPAVALRYFNIYGSRQSPMNPQPVLRWAL